MHPPSWLLDPSAEAAALAELVRVSTLAVRFADEFGAVRVRWSDYNLSRLLRLTGERPARVDEMRRMVLGLCGPRFKWLSPVGVLDHGEFWGRRGRPWAIVSHPYHLDPGQRAAISELGRFTPRLKVSVDDRPSHYGFGTHHVRLEVPEPRTPYRKPPSTHKTRAVSAAFRRALADE